MPPTAPPGPVIGMSGSRNSVSIWCLIVCGFRPKPICGMPLRAGLHHDIAGLDEPLRGGLQIRIRRHGLIMSLFSTGSLYSFHQSGRNSPSDGLRLDEWTRPMP